MFYRYAIYLTLSLLLCLVASAQDDLPVENTGLEPGASLSGTLNDNNPRQVYSIEGTRGEVVQLQLTAVDEGLDPVISIFDSQGRLLLYRE